MAQKPELDRVDPNGFGLSLSMADGYVYESGNATIEFTIQSVSKPFTYALAIDWTPAPARVSRSTAKVESDAQATGRSSRSRISA